MASRWGLVCFSCTGMPGMRCGPWPSYQGSQSSCLPQLGMAMEVCSPDLPRWSWTGCLAARSPGKAQVKVS